MFVAFVYVVAVPDDIVWLGLFFGLVIVVNRFVGKWMASVKEKRKILNAA